MTIFAPGASPALQHACLPSRRRVLAALCSLPVVTACGGGGGGASPPADSPVPVIDGFGADSTQLFVGDSAHLTAVFRGGSGTIEPGGIPVTSGVPFATAALAQSTTFTLRVQSPGAAPAERTLAVQVAYRDRYALAAGSLAVSQHSATAARDGAVIVIGGSRGLSTLADGIDRFDPATRTFRSLGALATGRGSHRATALSSGGILVTGGMRSSGDSRVAERVDDLTGQCVAAGTMSVPRVDHAAVLLPDGRVFVTGGYSSGERALLGISSSAELWNPADNTFRRIAATMQLPRAAHAMTVLPDGKVLVTGGYTSATPYVFAEVFDPVTETFAALADASPMRASHAAHLAPDGRVLLLGGETIAADGMTIVPLASCLAYDAATRRLAPLPALARPRTFAASVMLASGDVLLFGGQEQLPGYTATAERYTEQQGGSAIASLDGGRALHSATRLADGRVAIIGGEATGGAFRSTVQLYE